MTPGNAALHIRNREVDRLLISGGEAPREDGRVGGDGAVREVPMIGEGVAIGIGGIGSEGQAATHGHGGGAGVQAVDDRWHVAGKRPAHHRHIQRGWGGVLFPQHGEMQVRFIVAEGPAHADAAIPLAAAAARGGVHEVAGIAAEAAHDHQHGIRPQAARGRMVFQEKAALRVLVHAQRITFALLQDRLVIGVEPVDAVGGGGGARAMQVGVRQPAEGAFAVGIVVRAETAATAHDVRAVAIFLIGPHADRGTVGGLPEVRVIPAEGVAAFVIEHIHPVPGNPHAVTAAPGNAAEPRAFIHADHGAVVLAGVVAQLARFRAGIAVHQAESIHFRILGNIPCLGVRHHNERSHRRGGGHPAEGAFQIVARHIAHIALGGSLGVRRAHLVRISHADVETAEVADRLRRSAGKVVLEVACHSRASAGHALGFLENPDVGAIA